MSVFKKIRRSSRSIKRSLFLSSFPTLWRHPSPSASSRSRSPPHALSRDGALSGDLPALASQAQLYDSTSDAWGHQNIPGGEELRRVGRCWRLQGDFAEHIDTFKRCDGVITREIRKTEVRISVSLEFFQHMLNRKGGAAKKVQTVSRSAETCLQLASDRSPERACQRVTGSWHDLSRRPCSHMA